MTICANQIMLREHAGIIGLADIEIDAVSGGLTATQLAGVAAGLAGAGGALVGVCPPVGAGFLAVAATAELVAFVMTA
ncbi:hypothetical protein [uncultured Agrobacterium sp.]|uniref:hypothetical protein n=1 Tax=uncultured Agrobacterium sp. TaxID=157277 RepID=UPI0025FCE90A|nr:hypothetical protein [uncultured Agrobacterium sp.]